MSWEITGVTRLPITSGLVFNFGIDGPSSKTHGDGHLLEIVGWVAGASAPIEVVHVNFDHSLLVRVDVNESRPDVPAAFPGVDISQTCGFRTLVALVGLPETFSLTLHAGTADGRFEAIAQISGRRDPLPASAPGLDPLMVTSLGRTGTSWLMHLLMRHDRIATYPRWGYELSASGYWLRQLREQIEHPHGTGQARAFKLDASGQNGWGGQDPFEAADFADWFAGPHVEMLAEHTRQKIRGCYSWLARDDEQPRYFAEKLLPDHRPWLLRELFPGAREILLVRDFRDMVCSILAYNERRGFVAFDREHAESDERYPHVLRCSVQSLVDVIRQRPDTLVVRYEDLIAAPNETLGRVLRHLELPADEHDVTDLLSRSEADVDATATHRTSSTVAASLGRWRTELPSSVVAACEEAFGPALDEFGYR